MKYMYAALLLHSAAQPVNEANVAKILTAAGVKPEDGRVKALVAALSEVKIDEALKAAKAAPVAVAAPAAAALAGKKEEKKPEEDKKKEEEALAGLGALFG
ncbi:50S ribosomal protein P1 [Candidatus Bathyarchaeota archaeon]|jgi:large subunit ribosomal protein L12|nr:50S ribosomal protein P1 [Candidatus Bathyarchaeota archaeon]